jgi:hypothetical protein
VHRRALPTRGALNASSANPDDDDKFGVKFRRKDLVGNKTFSNFVALLTETVPRAVHKANILLHEKPLRQFVKME